MGETEQALEPATGMNPDPTFDAQPAEIRQPLDPNNPSWGLGGALLVWLISIGLIIFVPQIFLIPYVISKGYNLANPETVQEVIKFATSDPTAVILQIVALLPSHLITLFLVWALVTRFGKRPFWSALGWSWSPRLGPWACIGLGFLLVIVASAVAKVIGGEITTPLDQIINSSPAARYLISFFAVATAPIVEEFVYRGVLFAPLQRWVGPAFAVVVVLLLFTVIHVPQYWPNLGVIAAVGLLSVVLTVIRAYTGRLLPCVAIHFVFNGIQAAWLVAEPHVERFLPSPEPVAPPALFLISLLF